MSPSRTNCCCSCAICCAEISSSAWQSATDQPLSSEKKLKNNCGFCASVCSWCGVKRSISFEAGCAAAATRSSRSTPASSQRSSRCAVLRPSPASQRFTVARPTPSRSATSRWRRPRFFSSAFRAARIRGNWRVVLRMLAPVVHASVSASINATGPADGSLTQRRRPPATSAFAQPDIDAGDRQHRGGRAGDRH